MKVLAIIRDLNLRCLVSSGCGAYSIWNQPSGNQGLTTTGYGSGFYDPAISYERLWWSSRELKKTYPQYAWGSEESSLCNLSIVLGRPLIRSAQMWFPNTEQCTAPAVQFKERWSARSSSPYDKGYRRLHRSPTPHFSQPRAFSWFIQSVMKKKIGRVNGLIRGSFSKIEKQIRFEKAKLDFFLKWWSHFVIFLSHFCYNSNSMLVFHSGKWRAQLGWAVRTRS